MKRYKAFISYRKDHASYADLTKNTLVNGYGFAKEDLFLDKHDIGPEQFNVRIEESIKASSALILIITPNCLLPREDDWYLREIKFALKNNVTIIPFVSHPHTDRYHKTEFFAECNLLRYHFCGGGA